MSIKKDIRVVPEIHSALDVVNWLKSEHNYKEHKQFYTLQYKYKTLLQKHVESEAVCELNDKLSIFIRVCEIDIQGDVFDIYEIQILAKKKDKFWNLNCYSMKRSEIVSDLKEVEQDLIKLFNRL